MDASAASFAFRSLSPVIEPDLSSTIATLTGVLRAGFVDGKTGQSDPQIAGLFLAGQQIRLRQRDVDLHLFRGPERWRPCEHRTNRCE